ncbi:MULTISPECIES: hypothetical protein [unclassified Clostridioides]|uniref:hypothetical protein n=1 Tax=unclassified Clostridioides TaxID=2635829 RepID=UPI001D12BB71|nr:hypothetical protein [Clostridioides sp. ZZV14-6048]MCC0740008.1 hypothetical protein [Clostridioides sp. ZZV14-5902]
MDKIKKKIDKITKSFIKIFNFLEKKIQRINENRTISNKSITYYALTIAIVFGFGFFFNSNALLNKEKDIRSTPLYEKQMIGGMSIEIRDRKYNPATSQVQFLIYVDNDNNFENKKMSFELREQNNPSQLIDLKARQIDANNYVIISNVPRKWTVLSLGIGEKVVSGDKYTIMNKIKIYSDIRGTEKSYGLKEKNTNEYLGDTIDKEIIVVQSKIKDIEKDYLNEENEIKRIENDIKSLEESRKYQTESELENSNSEINSLKNSITICKDKMSDYNKQIDELKQKIKKLEQKKVDFLN